MESTIMGYINGDILGRMEKKMETTTMGAMREAFKLQSG